MSDTSPTDTQPATKLRVLVVDNEPIWRQLHQHTLEIRECEVVIAEAPLDAEDRVQALLDDAVAKAHGYRCHVAVVDLRLRSENDESDISGLELIPRLAPTVSILCSGWRDAKWGVSVLQSPPEPPMRAHAFVGKEDGSDKLFENIEKAARRYWPYLYSNTFAKKGERTSGCVR